MNKTILKKINILKAVYIFSCNKALENVILKIGAIWYIKTKYNMHRTIPNESVSGLHGEDF